MLPKIYLIILAMIVATQLCRLGPLLLTKRFHVSGGFEAWIKYIPVGVLTSLIIPEFIHKSPDHLEINGLYLGSAIVALLVGLRFKNLVITTFVGVAVVAILRMFA